ncbi:MAG: flagellar hook-basal body complex protein FliE [Terriglobales bacterium]|jgi:flagellar hook-basal body complex protein FliE
MLPPLLSSTILPPITPPAAPAPVTPAGGGAPSFASELSGAMQQMESLQSTAGQQVNALIHGTSQDVHASMIAVEKADLAFGMMLQLRNKAVQAYQDIANMAF